MGFPIETSPRQCQYYPVRQLFLKTSPFVSNPRQRSTHQLFLGFKETYLHDKGSPAVTFTSIPSFPFIGVVTLIENSSAQRHSSGYSHSPPKWTAGRDPLDSQSSLTPHFLGPHSQSFTKSCQLYLQHTCQVQPLTISAPAHITYLSQNYQFPYFYFCPPTIHLPPNRQNDLNVLDLQGAEDIGSCPYPNIPICLSQAIQNNMKNNNKSYIKKPTFNITRLQRTPIRQINLRYLIVQLMLIS